MIKNILFDLDGTLIDSSKCIYSVVSALFAEMNIPMPEGQQKRRLIGPPIETTLKRYVDDPAPYGKRYREIYSTVDLKSTNFLYDGITDMLQQLSVFGFRLFVATSKNEPYARKILDFLGVKECFEGVYGSRYDLHRTVKSQVLQDVIKDFKLNKEECILIGDTIFDLEGAKNIGIKFAVVNYGFGEKEDFVGENIEFFADSPIAIAEKIEELYGKNY